MAVRWGFKTEAESTALEVRAELGLQATDRLDPLALAEHLEIPVVPLSHFHSDAPDAVRHLQDINHEAFSAVTVFCGSRRIIVHNDAHVPGRRASNLTHELSHGLLLHPPAPALDDRGCRRWDPTIEKEADILAGVLLLPQEACIAMALQGASDSQVALAFGTSVDMARWRMGASGARKIASRARAKRAKR